MITMQLSYTGTDGAALRFAQEMETTGIAERIRAQAGNLRYEYYQSLANPETVLLLDTWIDQKALDSHHASPMMQEILNLRSKYSLTVTAERYLADQEGIPSQDRAFLQSPTDNGANFS